jgi:hypothetical protein
MKRSLVSAIVLGAAGLLLARKHPVRQRLQNAVSRRTADQATRRYITYAIVPAWTISGLLDWIWHRQTKIETTSGTEESVTHLLMITEVGAPIILALFLEINAGVIALIAGGWVLHQLTVYWDLAYTVQRRVIPPREQMTHLFMQTVPFDILAMLACLHPEQFKALLGIGNEKPRFSLRLKRPGMPPSRAAALLGTVGLLVALPHVEELWRCWRAEQQGLKERDTPECARELYAA